jgi:hypothetical protein
LRHLVTKTLKNPKQEGTIKDFTSTNPDKDLVYSLSFEDNDLVQRLQYDGYRGSDGKNISECKLEREVVQYIR